MIITYYKLPLASIPFKEIPSLENIGYEYVYCSSVPLLEYMPPGFQLVGVYNLFKEGMDKVADLEDAELLFGSVVSDKLSVRGNAKCIKLGSAEKEILSKDLPHLKYGSGDISSEERNWFYMKEGNYFIFKSIPSTYENVKHLEDISLYSDSIIRLRIVMELLKKNVSDGIIRLTLDDYQHIAYKVLRADPILSKADDDLVMDGVNNWVADMVGIPLYHSIPIADRGRAK